MNRRDFLKTASLGAAMVAGGSFLVGCNSTEAIAPAMAPEEWDLEADVVVAGSGNGGLSAAALAAEGGNDVIVCEISAYIGGGSAYSGGFLHAWGCETWEEYQQHTEGLHDPVLAKTYIETLRGEYVPWLQQNNIPLTRDNPDAPGPSADYTFGSGESGYLKHKAYFDALAGFLTSKGGKIMTKTRVLRLVIDEDGVVCGVQAVEAGKEPIFIKASKGVVLATGGFQSNRGLMAKYLGPNGDTVRNMGTPYNTGSGMLMAKGVGAMTQGSFSTFSGIYTAIVPGPATEDDPEAYEKARAGDPMTLPGIGNGRPAVPQWINLLFPEQTFGIFVNLQGQRFVDESSQIDAKYPRIPQTIVKLKRGMALMIADQEIFDLAAGSEAILKGIEAQGGRYFKGDTIDELGQQLFEAYGFYKEPFAQMIAEYNRAIDNGTAHKLAIPRVDRHFKIATGPFYAVPTGVTAYHTFGGVAINENAQVLDVQRQPIPNLYATPPCAGIFREVYTGGVASAGTFGYIAGRMLSK